MAEVTALRAENQYQKKKKIRKTGSVQKGGSTAINDGLEAIYRRTVRGQSDDNNEDEEPVLLDWLPRRAAKKVPPRCSKCGGSGHTIRVCSI